MTPRNQPNDTNDNTNTNTNTALHHEQLDVYRAAIQFVATAFRIWSTFPRGHAFLTDQLRRAATSIPLNIAEGYGKQTRADRARFYDIARGSSHECAAAVDTAKALHLVEKTDYVEAKRLLVRIVSMLVRLRQADYS